MRLHAFDVLLDEDLDYVLLVFCFDPLVTNGFRVHPVLEFIFWIVDEGHATGHSCCKVGTDRSKHDSDPEDVSGSRLGPGTMFKHTRQA